MKINLLFAFIILISSLSGCSKSEDVDDETAYTPVSLDYALGRHPLDFYQEKNISIVGNSISTYSGYVNGNRTYYPKGDVNNVSKTWWMQLINLLGAKFDQNYSFSAGRVTNTHATYPSLISQVQRLNHTDILILSGGINDAFKKISIGTVNFTCPTDKLNESKFAQAYDKYVRLGMEKSDYTYCVIMKTTPTKYANVMRAIAVHYNLPCIDLNEMGSIEYYASPHPSFAGMQSIASYCFSRMTPEVH